MRVLSVNVGLPREVVWKVTEFLERGRLGFYLAVAREGAVGAGDPIVELTRDPNGFRVTEVTRLFAHDQGDVEGLRRAAAHEVIPESWRAHFRTGLSRLEGSSAARH
ncbi:MAG: 3-alpha domain-containing protein [Verrucomicrobiota bacterium]